MGDQTVGVQTASADTLRAVSDIWTRALGPKGRGANANLIHIGVGTKRILRLLDEIETAFGVKLPIGAALKLGTVEALANAIKTGRWPGPSPLVLLKDGSDLHPPLYLIAGAWGIILETCNLASATDHPGKTWGLQPPGFDGDEATLDSIGAMASYYVGHLRGATDQPVNVIGFSFGGLVALEMGRVLHRQNRRIGLVGLIDTPLAERRWPFATRARYLWARSKARLHGLLNVHGERRADAIRNIVRPLRNRILGMIFNHPAFASAYQPTLDIRLKAVLDRIIVANEKYIPSPIEVPVVLFKARPATGDLVDAEDTWRPYIRTLEVVEVEGRHGNMIRPPLVNGLAAAIAARLNGSESTTPADQIVRAAPV
jgi:thioesterase domain-containing protein